MRSLSDEGGTVLEGDEVEFDVGRDLHGRVLVVTVTGELDVATAPELRAAVVAGTDAPFLLVDLTPCTFVDSTGCRAIVVSAREVPGPTRVALVCPEENRDVYRVLDFVQMSTALKIYDALDDALADLSA
jgi:anti-sigma B factor antagonist